MEIHFFSRPKTLRLVRPHRIALLEWLRVLRHNIACEFTLLTDEAKTRLVAWWGGWSLHRLLAFRLTWPTQLKREYLMRSAQGLWQRFKQRGVSSHFWPFLFALGLVLGVGIKLWASHHITMGYEDYKLPPAQTLYDFQALEERLKHQPPQDPASAPPVYPACPLAS